MPIGLPNDLGSANSTGATVDIPSAAPVGVGERILVAAGGRGATIDTVTDAKGNTYTIDVSGVTGLANVAVASATVATAIADGDLITVAFSTGIANFAHARAVPGLAAVDQVQAHGQFNSTAWTSTDVNTTVANELVWGCSLIVGSATTSTADAPQIETTDMVLLGQTFTGTYRIVSSTGAYACSGTWGTGSGDLETVVASYQAGPPPEGIAFPWTRV